MAPATTDNAAEHRYEVSVDGEVVGFTLYRARPGLIAFIHTEVDGRRILHPEAMDTVHAEKDPLAVAPSTVRARNGGGDLAQRQFHAARRMDPSNCERSSPWAKRA